MEKTAQAIQIKGIREGLLVTLGEGDWQAVFAQLIEQIEQNAAFFQGAKLALEVGNRVLHAAELGTLRDRLADRNVSLWAVISQSLVTEQTAQMLGLATRISTPRPERTIKALDTTLEGENAVLLQRTLRSGFSVSSRGHVVVIGDVNPGAEIVAGGSVVVWGKLKGSVRAGVEEGEAALVCALFMEPSLLRIGEHEAGRMPGKKEQNTVAAVVKDGQIVFETWNIK